jgi:ubiquinone/menaquinone biosynthesis C-methylase UbiE
MATTQYMPRQPEPELLDLPEMVAAYAHADFEQVNQSFAQRIVSLAGELQAARCLELGTGPGDIPVRLVRLRPGWRVTAVDGSPPMLGVARLAAARAGVGEAIEFLQADAKDTGLNSRSYDVIFSHCLLHHIDNTTRMWSEIRRLAAAGALVVFRDLYRPPSPEHAEKIVRTYAANEPSLLQTDYRRSLLAAYTPDELTQQLAVAGLGHFRVEIVSDRHMDTYGRLD